MAVKTIKMEGCTILIDDDHLEGVSPVEIARRKQALADTAVYAFYSLSPEDQAEIYAKSKGTPHKQT